MKLKVSLIGAIPPPLGGISIYMRQLAEKLAEYGVFVEIIDITGLKKELKRESIKLVVVKSWHTLEFVRTLLKSQSAIFHVHVSTYRVDPIYLVTALIARLRKRKFMITILGGGFIHLMESPIYRKLLRLMILNIADGIIAIDEMQHKKVLEVLPFKRRKRVYFIAPPVDIVKFSPKVNGTIVKKKYHISEDQKVIVFGPHLEKIYAPDLFIRAATHVVKRISNAKFLLLGNGTMKREMELLIKKEKLENNVILCGAITFKDVPNYYAACDIYCNPCILGQGISTFEAMACGKPVIGARAKNQIRIKDKVDGLLFELENERDFAEKIIWLLENPTEAKRMGFNGRKRVEKFNNLEKQVKNHIDVYNIILKN